MTKKEQIIEQSRKMLEGVELTDIEYEILSYRLYAMVNEARQAVLRISGSPVVAEGGEALYALYNAEGLGTVLACGLLLHMIGTQGFVDEILDVQVEHPGINDGDIFMYNDPSIGGIHACDQWLGTPIYREGKLVAWLGSLTHTAETGAIEPGGMPPSSKTLLHEGYRVQGIKIQEKGYLNRASLNCVLRSTRDPGYYMLDMHAKIASLNVGKERLLKLMDQYGTAKILAVMQRNIDYSDSLARAKLKELADGTWRCALYGDSGGYQLDNLWKINCTATKKGDSLTLDFTGSSEENKGPVNCMTGGAIGSMFVAIASQLFWEVPWNYGVWKPLKVIMPEGSLVNCKFMSPCCMCPPFPGTAISNVVTELIAKMFFTNEKYWEDINAGWSATSMAAPIYGGICQHGYAVGYMFGDCWAAGTGAGIDRDGVDTGGLQMTAESCVTDVEMSELTHPYVYLWRREGIDTGGPGRWRGGAGVSFALMAHHNTPYLEFGWLGGSRHVSGTTSMNGAYPAGSYYPVMALNSGVKEKIVKGGHKPDTVDEVLSLPGDVKVYESWQSTIPIKDGDIYAFDGAEAGAGIGDPLDREPERVLNDVENKWHSLEMAEKVYGVVIDPKTMEVDEKATKARRAEIIAERKARGKVWKEGK